MKALFVTYLPRGEQSNTKKLADKALEFLKSKGVQVEQLDLCHEVPDFLTPAHVAAYGKRNYAGLPLSPVETTIMSRMDWMTSHLKSADLVVLAFPMYNFSQPATVKAWFDSVMLKGETWDMGPGGYKGLMTGKKALILSTSGGVYEGGSFAWEHAVSTTKVHFAFMGYEVDSVVAAGMNQFPDKAPAVIAQAKENIAALLERWIA